MHYSFLQEGLKEWSLTVVCAYASNIRLDNPALESIAGVLEGVLAEESFNLLGDFNVHISNDSVTRRCMIERNPIFDFNQSCVLLDVSAIHGLSITNIIFKLRHTACLYKCT